MSYGHELILDLHRCNTEMFTPDLVERFCVELCEVIDMEREDFHIWASDPADYETDPPHVHGVSAVQFITTSSIVVHTLPKLRAAYVNIFSCKRFDSLVAEEFVLKFFGARLAGRRWIERI